MVFAKPLAKPLLKPLVPVILACVLACVLVLPVSGAEYEDGFIRLTLNPVLGRFSLYYLSDPVYQKYEAMFMDQDPRTSVLTLRLDNKTYRLGESGEFSIREGGTARQPALIFESSSLVITEEFSFICTGGSPAANGVKISFHIENKDKRRVQAGLRLLLDTKLGESSTTPFVTDNRMIQEEIVFDTEAGLDAYWVSGTTEGPALMGSLGAGVDRVPDAVHIANWKRLNDVPWSLDFVQGRRFNNPPYSIRDSAVAYYYEPVRINGGESTSFFLLLASRDTRGFVSFQPSEGLPVPLAPEDPFVSEAPPPADIASAAPSVPAAVPTVAVPTVETETGPAPNVNPMIIRSDYNALRDIINRVDEYFNFGVPMSDDEIRAIEQDLARIRSRYP
ncbi:MAG: hypothetical protein LBF63_06940 [Treponema sp.]|jgi:hypothetical protein|nr:hypothetical protein [Treponema sp.]